MFQHEFESQICKMYLQKVLEAGNGGAGEKGDFLHLIISNGQEVSFERKQIMANSV